MSEHEHIQLRLMVSQQDHRPRLPQPIMWILDIEPHAREEPHYPFERASGCPLPEAAVADDAEESGEEGAVACAEEEGEEGGGCAAVVFEEGVLREGAYEDEELREGEDGEEEKNEG